MKLLMLFTFGSLFSFFDISLFFAFFFLFIVVFLLDCGGLVFGGVFFCDSLSFFLVFLTIFVFLFCMCSVFIEFWGKGFFGTLYVSLFLIFFLLLVCFFSLRGIFFYVCFEWIFVVMFFFILVWGNSPERLQASFYMVFYTLVVSFPFLVYLVFFESFLVSLSFVGTFSFSFYWWVFLFLVFFVKLPVYGLHLWLPKAHVEAPVTGSMLLAGVLLKLAGYAFFRFSSFVAGSLVYFSGYFFSVGLLGGVASCFLCLRQVDLKAFVAYSSVCHMGFCLSGIYCYSFYGLVGGLFMLIAHGFCSSCLFFMLYVFYERFHTRSLFLFKGVGVWAPSFVLFWFVFSVLNMGVPPSFSFFSEICILVGLSSFNFFSMVASFLLLFFAGMYSIFFFVVPCHGGALLESGRWVFMREYLICFGHVWPMFTVPLFLGVFF